MAQIDRTTLFKLMDDKLSDEEAQNLTFAVNLVDWENLPGKTKAGKLRELIEACEQREALDQLIAALIKLRPDIESRLLSPRSRPGVAQPQSFTSVTIPKLTPMRAVLFAGGLLSIVLLIGTLSRLNTMPSATPSATNVAPTALSQTSSATPALTASPAPITIGTPTVNFDAAGICKGTDIALATTELSTMMTIPGTAFVMGRSNSNNEAERPAHKVTVASFEIDRYEVTNLQYEAFIKAAQYITVPEHWVNNTFPSGQAFLPVVNVSWADANAYCASLGKRLPTEAEWELACRGADERLFPWGNNWESSQANTDGISCEQPLQVGTFSPRGDSPYGLSDLSGNVAEWTSSNLRNYPFDASLTEQIGDGTSLRAVRGGSWGDKQQVASCVARAGAPPAEFWADRIGFRCARTKP